MARKENSWFLASILDKMLKSEKALDSSSTGKVAKEVVEAAASHCADIALNYLESNLDNLVQERRDIASQFEERLLQSWERPLDLLEVVIKICCEAGDELNSECRGTAAKSGDYQFDVLTKLHARACQISYEIICLLKAGLADGAHARWRTLHEVVVDAYFIKSQGMEVAKRYLVYESIESYRDTFAYQKHCRRLGYEPLTDDELRQMKKRYEELRTKYGQKFTKYYGWVPENILSKPDFTHLETALMQKPRLPF